ncbi:MAG: hypothetical protein MK132_04625 [Lentisphaerales bacterium]|nr:hypothetical protein [Lentisphaerales bacterium]
MKSFIFIILLFMYSNSVLADERVFFLENDKMKLGISLSAGGGIFYLGFQKGENLLNFHDRGRFIQQSYYGKKDGSKWGDKNWVWHPVQAGNSIKKGAKILEFKKSPEAIYVKSVALHWATGESLNDCVMEQWIVLKSKIAHIRYKFTYTGDEEHPEKSQELPAVYVDSKYHKLAYYSGEKPWQDKEIDSIIPGWPNKTYEITEPWAAFVDENGFGLGVMSPLAEKITAYRYVEKNQLGPLSDDCSYMAPIAKLAINKNKPLIYDVFLTIGTLNSIRSRFSELNKNMKGE